MGLLLLVHSAGNLQDYHLNNLELQNSLKLIIFDTIYLILYDDEECSKLF